jgi:hypothetical protein
MPIWVANHRYLLPRLVYSPPHYAYTLPPSTTVLSQVGYSEREDSVSRLRFAGARAGLINDADLWSDFLNVKRRSATCSLDLEIDHV